MLSCIGIDIGERRPGWKAGDAKHGVEVVIVVEFRNKTLLAILGNRLALTES